MSRRTLFSIRSVSIGLKVLPWRICAIRLRLSFALMSYEFRLFAILRVRAGFGFGIFGPICPRLSHRSDERFETFCRREVIFSLCDCLVVSNRMISPLVREVSSK